MSSPNPRIINEMAEEIDALSTEGVGVQIGERVSIPAHDANSQGYENVSCSDSVSTHMRRLKIIKAMEQGLKHRESLKWYEVAVSYLNNCWGDIIRESSGMPVGYDLA